ncbi:hypothetical protein Q4489_05795 [Thalassotalea sp. 1_MG-2023]|uniref:hypothetical protein n=1 Tax=Thalassotalea sp. 1_MG-2023 TaxID=3062680 RepID=UPI0026E14A4E|nr:hypothetical protein [Thalassotalea sp. 1_MG-2023]MDO6426516.1 hypothetical protein [Thalassotalea sp. 1_MG-2023]
MHVNLPKTVDCIYQEIETEGFASIEDAISAEDLNTLQSFIIELTNKNKGTFSIVGHENLKNSLLGSLYNNEKFLSFQAELVSKKTNENPDSSSEKYQVLRVLNGGNLNTQSHLFHFDNFTLTVLLPIFIPSADNEKNGDLLILPNIRKVSSSPVKNALIKLFTQNPVTRFILKAAMVRKLLNFKSIKLEPGKLYFFWGFSTYHGNDDCHPGNMRSTALFHFHKPVTKKSILSKITSTKKRSRVKV